jgi:hypothetical protein
MRPKTATICPSSGFSARRPGLGVHDPGYVERLELIDGVRLGDAVAERPDMVLVPEVGLLRLVGVHPVEEGV